MSNVIKMSCPKCGGKDFKPRPESRSPEDFAGAVCAKCSYTITKSDVRKQILDPLEKIARDALRKAGFK